VVVVYLTEDSLNSKMVAKEMDAALIQQLGDSGVSFLPYVKLGKLREKLRTDIRSLHCREWNDENYSDILPAVVAEIWRSYTERMVVAATLQEENRRLKLELELKSINEQLQASTFTLTEENEFRYLLKTLDREIKISDSKRATSENHMASSAMTSTRRFSLLASLVSYLSRGVVYFDYYDWAYDVGQKMAKSCGSEDKSEGRINPNCPGITYNPTLELQTYGLLRHVEREGFRGQTDHYFELTEKMYRFKYWLAYNNHFAEVTTL